MADVPEVDYHVTAAQLDTGMRGVPVGTCWTSLVDPDEGVSYVGYPIADLAYLPPESVLYLLYNKDLPNEQELQAFRQDLAARSSVDPALLDLIGQLPRSGHPMEWFCTAIQLLGMTTKTGDYKEDALNLVARIPEVLAAIFRIREGWGDLVPSKPELGYVENFVQMLGMPGADQAKQIKLLRTYYNLHLDHGGGNLSTFTGKAVASGLADVYQSMSSAMNGLAGPRHGRATQDCFEMVQEIGSSDPAEVETRIRARLDSGGLVFGFGHAVLRSEDPRAKVEFDLGEDIAPDDKYFKIVKAMRSVVPKVLSENAKIQNPHPNVDFVSGSLLQAVGFTDMEYYTTLFGWSRVAGIGAQIADERMNFRNGRGVAIYRPKYIAVNQDTRSV
jgi:citrate synthase